MLIDSHAHLINASMQEDVEAILQRAYAGGIRAIVNICTTPQEVEKGLLLSAKYPWVYTAAATTPHTVADDGEAAYPYMEQAALAGTLCALGETGLDYHHYAASKEIQKIFLRKYLQLAKRCRLPVIIHCRDAFADLFQILDEEYKNLPGVLHCFTGTQEEAYQVIERGWYLSLSGIVTFKKSQWLQQIACTVPLNQILIETDAPYLAPTPHRSKRNEPAFLLETAKCIAALRGITLEELAEATTANARSLFRLPHNYSRLSLK